MRMRSYDFYPGDDLFLEGECIGYVDCKERPGALDSFIGFSNLRDQANEIEGVAGNHEEPQPLTIVAAISELPETAHVHAALKVESMSPGWIARGRKSNVGQVVFPELGESGMVVPLG